MRFLVLILPAILGLVAADVPAGALNPPPPAELSPRDLSQLNPVPPGSPAVERRDHTFSHDVEQCRRELLRHRGWQEYCTYYWRPRVEYRTRTRTVTRTPQPRTTTATSVLTETTTTTSTSTSTTTSVSTDSSTTTEWTTTTLRGGESVETAAAAPEKRDHRSLEYAMRRYPYSVIRSACANAVGRTRTVYRTRTVTRTAQPRTRTFTTSTTTTATATAVATSVEVTATTTTEVVTASATETAFPRYPCGDADGVPGGKRDGVYVWDENGSSPVPNDKMDIVQTNDVHDAKTCCDICWGSPGGGCAVWRLAKHSDTEGYCFTLFGSTNHGVCPNEPLFLELQFSQELQNRAGEEWSAGPGPCTPDLLDTE